MNIIQQLKDNRYPFGMWPDPECYGKELGEAMQAKARELGKSCFQFFDNFRRWVVANLPIFELQSTYRLRPDYEEEPKIVEVRIYDESNERYFLDDGEPCRVHAVIASVHCAGFKFEDGGWYDAPIKPVGPDGKLWSGNITVDDIVSGRVKILHATHVLIRRSK